MTTGREYSCRCDPARPSLVMHTEDGDVAVRPAAAPGPLAALYYAYCTGCGAAYPGPFRARPAAHHRPGKLLPVPGPRKEGERARSIPASPWHVLLSPPDSIGA